jgi:hypothetical protein
MEARWLMGVVQLEGMGAQGIEEGGVGWIEAKVGYPFNPRRTESPAGGATSGGARAGDRAGRGDAQVVV